MPSFFQIMLIPYYLKLYNYAHMKLINRSYQLHHLHWQVSTTTPTKTAYHYFPDIHIS